MSAQLFYGIKIEKRMFHYPVERIHVLTRNIVRIPRFTYYLESVERYISLCNVESLEKETGVKTIYVLEGMRTDSPPKAAIWDAFIGATWESIEPGDYRNINHAALYEIEKEACTEAINDLAIACGTVPTLWIISE